MEIGARTRPYNAIVALPATNPREGRRGCTAPARASTSRSRPLRGAYLGACEEHENRPRDRAQVAAPLEGVRRLPRREPGRARIRRQEAEVLRPRHVPVPLGLGPPRRARGRVHRHGHRRAEEAHGGLQRPPSDGLGRVRPARRAVCDPDRQAPARDHRGEHEELSSTARSARALVRLVPRPRHERSPRTTAGRSGSSCAYSSAVSRTRPRCRSGGARS